VASEVRRPLARFLLAFACVFAGLALLHGPGPSYARAHAFLGNAVLEQFPPASEVRLWFVATDTEAAPWSATLHVESRVRRAAITVPIDLRSLVFLPTAAFIALSIAAPLRSVRCHLWLLTTGLLILEPLLLALLALPLLSFLGGLGPIRVFTLGRAAQVFLQLLYRALILPPGMTYAIPLFVWWLLLALRGDRLLQAGRATGDDLVVSSLTGRS
jgi:hypothetical protein